MAIWSWQGPKCICAFLWKIVGNSLLANNIRSVRTNDPSCVRCETDIENLDRALRHCPLARAVWYFLLPWSKHSSFFNLETGLWLLQNLRADAKIGGRIWSQIFAVMLDILWQC
uniref:Ribonuclease H protein At1g65750 family n=1 Tax=Cajanus cajan TaxID=3821 RepID=A0A151SMJ4_CAJCA|nr:Putative ribonuclease H protein At1g65750 family [Cajanus cajan]